MNFFFEKFHRFFKSKIDFESTILALFVKLSFIDKIKKNPLSMLILGQKSEKQRKFMRQIRLRETQFLLKFLKSYQLDLMVHSNERLHCTALLTI